MYISEEKLISIYEACPIVSKFGKYNIEFGIEEGWHDLFLRYLVKTEDYVMDNFTPEEMEEISLAQVKQKLGFLTVYFNYPKNGEYIKAISDIWQDAANESGSICEKTGEPGERRNVIGYIAVLCDEEYEKAIEKKIKAYKPSLEMAMKAGVPKDKYKEILGINSINGIKKAAK